MKIPKEYIDWKQVGYLRQGETRNYDYHLWLNEPLASWDVFDYWERERVISMRTYLKKGDILFDIGTEQGWCNLAYAQMVGPENMVLIEPTPDFWPNIQALWERNYPGVLPKGTFAGFFSDKTEGNAMCIEKGFPRESKGDLIDKNSYKYIHEHAHEVPQITLDNYVLQTGIVPTALTIDVEGAELKVLQGAEKTLKTYPLKVWVSEHDDLAEQNYGVKPGDVATFMQRLGYNHHTIHTDHERHVYYSR